MTPFSIQEEISNGWFNPVILFLAIGGRQFIVFMVQNGWQHSNQPHHCQFFDNDRQTKVF
jgi:hypothetical protein